MTSFNSPGNVGIVLKGAAAELDLEIDPGQLETLVFAMQSFANFDEEGGFRARFINEHGDDIAPVDLVRALAKAQPQTFRSKAKPEKAPAAPVDTTKLTMTDRMAITRANQAATPVEVANQKAVAELVAAHGNPWTKGRQNLSRQMAVLKHDPQLAAKLKAEAGV